MHDFEKQSQFLSLLQVFDSAFPYGSYAHSLGLEGLVQLEVITDEQSLVDFFDTEVLPSLQSGDLPIFRFIHTAILQEHYAELLELDDLAMAIKGTKEIRDAGEKMGKQLFSLIGKIYDSDEKFQESWSFIHSQLPHKQLTSVIASFCAIKSIDMKDAMAAFVMQMIQSWSQACVKLIGFGPMQAQRFVTTQIHKIPRCIESSLDVEKADIGFFSSRWDIASSKHEKAHARLFIS